MDGGNAMGGTETLHERPSTIPNVPIAEGERVHLLVRSRVTMMLGALGAILASLGMVCGTVAFAVLSRGNQHTSQDLIHAHDWLFFAGSVVALIGVSILLWQRVVGGVADLDTAEIGGFVLALLFIAIGALLSATDTSSSSGDTLIAVGIGIWGLLAVVRAARASISESKSDQPSTQTNRVAALWLVAAVGSIVLAVGWGLSFSSAQGTSIASGVILAVGIAIWIAAIAQARSEGLFSAADLPPVLVGLGFLLASFVAEAVVAGIVLGPNGTLTGLRVGGAIVSALEAAGFAGLGLAAWLRMNELPARLALPARASSPLSSNADRGSSSPTTVAEPSSEGVSSVDAPQPVQTQRRFCTACGRPLAAEDAYCGACGAPVVRT